MADLNEVLGDFGLDLSDLDFNGSLSEEDIADYMRNFSLSSKGDSDQYQRDLLTYYIMGIGGMTVCCFGLIGECTIK